ncbi:MotA/TolQ/ExbB proton channel family protein [Pendulispora brunnea]|uniref:MotA/TolQ/ExbB proton channel family protein n=1 Tax=Pendulispora brunnea TaxID=2905690 RepID=A0ABZ2JZN9_9BACT
MDFSLYGLWHSMGAFAKGIVITLAIMSLASLLVAGERLIIFSRSRKESLRFAEQLGGVLTSDSLREAAAKSFKGDIGYLGRTIASGLKAFNSGGSSTDEENINLTEESVARALERQTAREVQNLKRGITVLATVSSTAPFVGLLGTVMGIVNSFQQMAASGSGGLGTVSAGIAEALVTTAFGLLVAIPAVMLFNYLSGWVDARAVDLAESSNELMDLVARYHRRHLRTAAQAAE